MGELRKDLYSNRFVLMASERSGRPTDQGAYHKHLPVENQCPFCEGQEHRTPPEVAAIRKVGAAPNTGAWKVRVVPNKYPALQPIGQSGWRYEHSYQWMDNIGVHEVIIETPNHQARLPELSAPQMLAVVTMYRDRYRVLAEDRRWESLVLFRNSGGLAGASLAHPHAQLVALPAIPKRLMEMVTYGTEQFEHRKACVFCDLITREKGSGVRVVHENEYFLVFQPFAPRVPFETLVFPKRHQSRFSETDETQLPALAEALQNGLGRMDRLLGNPPFNLVIHSAPTHGQVERAMHWHVEFMPRLAELGGFEWGSECYMHPIFPEQAAKMLREA